MENEKKEKTMGGMEWVSGFQLLSVVATVDVVVDHVWFARSPARPTARDYSQLNDVVTFLCFLFLLLSSFVITCDDGI